MVEKMIELWIEHQRDKLDKKYMNNEISAEQYEISSKEIDKRAKQMYDCSSNDSSKLHSKVQIS